MALDEMILDFQLMCQNAQTFNESNSIIYKDAERIKNFVDSRLKDFQEVNSPYVESACKIAETA